jgi:hypothetical protein
MDPFRQDTQDYALAESSPTDYKRVDPSRFAGNGFEYLLAVLSVDKEPCPPGARESRGNGERFNKSQKKWLSASLSEEAPQHLEHQLLESKHSYDTKIPTYRSMITPRSTPTSDNQI